MLLNPFHAIFYILGIMLKSDNVCKSFENSESPIKYCKYEKLNISIYRKIILLKI